MDEPLTEENLVNLLEQLRVRLNRSGVERTAGLHDAMGDGCEYYWKSMNVFMRRDFADLEKLVQSTNRLFQKISLEND